MPPCDRPNNIEITYSETMLSNGMKSSSEATCSDAPSTSVRKPPMRSQMNPNAIRLTTPKPSISESICAPRAGP